MSLASELLKCFSESRRHSKGPCGRTHRVANLEHPVQVGRHHVVKVMF